MTEKIVQLTNEQCLKKFFKEIGTGAYILLFLTLITITTKNTENLIFSPTKIKNYKIYTILTFPLTSLGITNTLFQIFFIISWSFLSEKNFGTAYFLYWIFFYSFLQGICHFFLFLFKLNFFDLKLVSIWPVYFLDISRRCFENPYKISGILFIPINIKNFIFPFVIFSISFVFNGFVFIWSDITSIFLGWILMKFCKNFEKIFISKKNIIKIDWFLSFFGFLGTFYDLEQRENVNSSYFQNKIVKFFDYNRKLVLKILKKKYDKKKNVVIQNDIENRGFSQKGNFLEKNNSENLQNVDNLKNEVNFENEANFENGENFEICINENFIDQSQNLDNAKILRNDKKDIKEEDMFSI